MNNESVVEKAAETTRELFSSRVGGILMAAGCAIGLGNIWRFPYIAGKNGGAWFVLIYLICLAVLAFPILLAELAMGRAGKNTLPGEFRTLKNPSVKFKWDKFPYLLFAGNYILLMFYTCITGWLLFYFWKYLALAWQDAQLGDSGKAFGGLVGSWKTQCIFMYTSLILAILACVGGVKKSIEKVIKFTMIGLLLILGILVIRAVTLPGAGAGLSLYLKPNMDNLMKVGFFNTLCDAMMQAFFTLSIGIGSISICGSYMKKDASLPTEGTWIVFLDTLVAFAAGLVIFAACAACNVPSDKAGPGLVFMALPGVFDKMPGGNFWGVAFFLFMFLAAYSTLLAVFENLVAFGIDEFRWSRIKSNIIAGVLLAVLCLPCVLGFNVWSGFEPFGKGTCVLDLEDFIVSNNLLPLGGLYIIIFCTSRFGWGEKNFLAELNTGNGWKMPKFVIAYMKWVLPTLIFVIWLIGILRFFKVIE